MMQRLILLQPFKGLLPRSTATVGVQLHKDIDDERLGMTKLRARSVEDVRQHWRKAARSQFR